MKQMLSWNYIPRIIIVSIMMLTSVCTFAQDAKPAIVMKADRILVFPQRMELSGEETLLDILMMCPDLMQKGFDDMIGSYNLRIDNVAMSGNTRLLCTQIKANLISKVQICDNTGVAKGTVGNNRVIDVNLLRLEEGTHGFVGVQGGTDNLVAPSAEVRYGSKNTDIFANTSYTYLDQDNSIKNNEHLTFHMTNWFSKHDRLLTYFTQQYLHNKAYGENTVKNRNEKYMGRARYFHNFNDKGTELLLLAGYQHSNNPVTTLLPANNEQVVTTSQDYYIGLVELNTPLFLPNVSLMLGWEGDWANSTYSKELTSLQENDYSVVNNDIYAQVSYTTGMWNFTIGDRIMFYHYATDGYSHNDTRNNLEASAILSPNNRNQIQLAYHRKFSNPSFSVNNTMTEEEWLLRKGVLKAAYIDETKLGYTYSQKNMSITSSLAHLAMENAANTLRYNLAGYYKKDIFAINAGANLYNVKGDDNDFATFFLAPKVSLPCKMQIAAKSIFFTKNSTLVRDQKVYAELQANKQLGKQWDLQVMWHDIFSSKYSAALASVQYRF